MKTLLSRVIFWRYTLSGTHISAMCHLWHKLTNEGSQQEIVEIFRKLAPIVI